jgi:hypothetical protein
MPFPAFDRSRLRLQPLANRQHDLDLSAILPLDAAPAPFDHPAVAVLGRRLVEAKRRGAARILMMGAHVLRAGVSRHLIDLMERGLISHVAMNGAGPIHDWEFALIGATTESVARYIQSGWARRSAGRSSTGRSRTGTSASWPRGSASACR